MTDEKMLMNCGFFPTKNSNSRGKMWDKCWWKSILYKFGWRPK